MSTILFVRVLVSSPERSEDRGGRWYRVVIVDGLSIDDD
jgi:hypothetical protein